MYKKLLFIFGMLFLASCTTYDYEVCNDKIVETRNGDFTQIDQYKETDCQRVSITNIVQPSLETTRLCNSNWKESGAMHECEDVPANLLLSKGGTNKRICNKIYAIGGIVADNYWNAEGVVDGCEMPPNSNTQWAFKQHDQTFRSHTGTIQIRIDVVNFDNDYKALQIFIGENNNGDGLPDSWVYCGNVDKIYGHSTSH